MMEKQGIVAPEITPPEYTDTAKTAAVFTGPCEIRKEAVEQLDADFRKSAAEATRKSLQ